MSRTFPLLAALLIGLAGCSTLPSHRSSRDRYSNPRSYPSSAKRTERGQERYVLCHNGRSSTFPTAAVQAHLRHGDRFGSCRPRDDRHDDDHGGRGHDRDDDHGHGHGH